MSWVGLGAKHLPICIPKLQTRALVKINISTKALYLWFLDLIQVVTTFFSTMVHSVEAYSFAPTRSMSSGLIQSWQPPVGWSYKLNFDAMLFADMEASRFGAVIQNNKGQVMAVLQSKGLVVTNSEEAEVLACKKALEFVVEAGFSNLGIERCRHCILYPLRLGLPFSNDVGIPKSKVGLGPNQIEIDLRKEFLENKTLL